MASLYQTWVDKYFQPITLKVVEKLNDDKRLPSYRFRQLLRERYSVSGKWDSVGINNRLVAADYVSLDSPLPLKSRPTFGRVVGDIGKMGLEFRMNEQELTDLDKMVATGIPGQQIVNALFQDVPRAVGGIYEQIEKMTLEAISTGEALGKYVDDKNGIRLDYGFYSDHKFGVSTVWSNVASAKPIDDIVRILNEASNKGDSFVKMMIDRKTAGYLLSNDQIKGQFAFNAGFVGSNIPTLSETNLSNLFRDRFGVEVDIVDRVVKEERDGQIANVKPWKEGVVAFLTDNQVGDLVYATLAEENHPAKDVTYVKANSYILLARGVETRPSLMEFTRSQARVVPVINADSVYLLDTTQVQA